MLRNLFRSTNRNVQCRFSSTLNTVVQKNTETVDNNEVQHFKTLKNKWWKENGEMQPLHSMNNLRVPFIRDGLLIAGSIDKQSFSMPLKNLHILDVGCGGGILTEPLARLGGNVTGIDATKELIDIAKEHAQNNTYLKTLNYQHISIEEHVKENVEKYDAVVLSEVIEHVSEKDTFLDHCINCLKPGGSIFVTTLNQTLASRIGAIFLAENVFNFIPKGTHDWDKFISPHAVQRQLEMFNCRTRLIHGMFYNFINDSWHWTSNTSISYALHAIKDKGNK